jgi:hypothetical protein
MSTLVGNMRGEDNKAMIVGKKPILLTNHVEKEPSDI